MANFINDDQDNNIEQNDTEVSDINDNEIPNEVADQGTQDAPQEASEEDEVPEKYRGKDLKEIIRMHQEAEKAIGRKGAEVGDLRRIVDDFIKAQTANKEAKAPADVEEEVDFFADPQKAIEKAIAKHPKVKEAENVAVQLKRAETLATLKANHPDFQDVIASQEFADWVGKSKVRQELYLRADQAFDLDAADELLSTWKERQEVVAKTKAVEQVERKQAVKAASTSTARGSAEASSKKIYRRQDIINLMMRDPERYAALSDEIMQAYAEKRVR